MYVCESCGLIVNRFGHGQRDRTYPLLSCILRLLQLVDGILQSFDHLIHGFVGVHRMQFGVLESDLELVVLLLKLLGVFVRCLQTLHELPLHFLKVPLPVGKLCNFQFQFASSLSLFPKNHQISQTMSFCASSLFYAKTS